MIWLRSPTSRTRAMESFTMKGGTPLMFTGTGAAPAGVLGCHEATSKS